LGIFTALTGLAVVGGPVVGGAITEGLAWQWIFWVNVPIGLVVIPLVLRQIDESFGPNARIDTGGVLLVTGATLGLVWGLVRANSVGWLSVEVLGTLAAGVVLGAAFVWWELRTGEPMLPMRLFRIPAFTAGNASALLLYGSLLSTVFFLAQYLQVSLGYGPLAAGIRVLPWTSTVFILAPVSGVLADRIGARPLIVLGLVLQAVGFGWIANNIDHGRSYSSSIAALIIAGCGVTMAMPAVQNAVMNSVPSAAIGKASGAFNTVRQLGAVFGVAVLAATFSAHGSYRSPVDFGNGVGPALAVAAAMSLAGAIIGLGTPGRVRRDVSLHPSPQPAMEPALATGGADNATG
jgi:MFS family permease